MTVPTAVAGPSPLVLAEAAASAALLVDGVAGLDGGPLGAIATYGSGRRCRGVTVAAEPGRTRLTLRLVVRASRPIPDVADDVRAAVLAALPATGHAGEASVDVMVVDLEAP